MPRVLVTTDPSASAGTAVLLDEQVQAVHLSDDHSAAQLIERLGWAIGEAEATELAQSRRPSRRRPAREPRPVRNGAGRVRFTPDRPRQLGRT
jgi:hypothetical protein